MSSWFEKIEQELDWRERELTSMKILVITTKNNSTKQALRSLIVMLYAHYEGFCKFAWDLYLNGIAAR
ncbi:MAG: hypothetical protein DSM107014_02110 [Gomphosphaeria aponina SAG 52.96 = DSM 107014]|uniref:MAE-28990/MAE-18760-like HEPN domain-containing protein n=1 Tax=Gomphosphaeria aponina SAG 52.96 = DSM 107014 TaxID=1521640 RepID=A0A941JSD9_9CHRO|nr:hypothetical protein [Gomphosphaeria aponina SAG 52.96 = DSM 107014]